MKIKYKKYSYCPYCKSKIKTIYKNLADRLETVKDRFEICECLKCHLVFTNPIPLTNLGVLYPTYYLTSKNNNQLKKFDAEKLYRYDQYKFDFGLFEQITGNNIEKIKSYLDIGCGSGDRVIFVRDRGCKKSYGIDKFDNLKIKMDNIYNSEIIKFKPKEKFEVVSLFHVLEHVDNFEVVIKHIKKHIIKSNGFLIIQVPNYSSIERKIFKSRWFCFDVPRHLWHFNSNFLINLFTTSGYTVVGYKIQNATFHPVSIGSSLLKDMDIQRIWVKRKGIFYKVLWIILTIFTIPISILENLFDASPMLTMIFIPKRNG